MKTSRSVLFLAAAVFSIATAAVAAPERAIDPDAIKDKVSIKLGQELHIKFAADGERLVQPRNVARARGDEATVEIKLDVTDSTPVPVRGVPTRPYLVVNNGLERTLSYRALARLKGSKEFFELGGEVVKPIARGDQAMKCWLSGSLVEEVVLYQFALTPKPSK
jgi:hypothetical protein